MGTFDTILIANRGEIAVRVIRTARAMGYRTVAVFSDADASAPHVQMADLAVRIGPGPVSESYLSIDALLDAATKTGAGAVHPGYGFLAENAGFARRCKEAGLTFIGPPESAITLMGDKVQAKRRMIDAGVPTAPGYHGDEQDEATLVRQAQMVGAPLLVKAVAGGGGRGMRKVTALAELPEAIASARSEAKSAFGNGDLFLEKLVQGARHVEIQVFADTHGNVVHLHERECSVQRRHQKIIEEAPSPVVDSDLRAKMGEAAVSAARAIDYVGAGTVEFLLDDDGNFYFLEMNTRLQVEHPVTELVTGFDLVQWQLAVAAGERLPVAQGDIPLRGHAIEVRLYAEDPHAGFIPQVGRVELFEPPRSEGVRIDTGIESGQDVSPYYDPMLAKVIAHGQTRADATRRLRAGLRQTSVLGIVTNRGFLLDLLGSEAFASAAIKTDTIDRDGAPPQRETPPQTWALAAVLRSRHDERWTDFGPWRSSGTATWPVELRRGDEVRHVRLTQRPDGMVVATFDEAHSCEIVCGDVAGASHRVTIDGVQQTVRAVVVGRTVYVDHDGVIASFEEPQSAAKHEIVSDGRVVSPMGGKVVSVHAEPGMKVEAGQRLVVVEAMKMEHRVTASVPGTVTAVSAKAGDQVASGQLLVTIEMEDQEQT